MQILFVTPVVPSPSYGRRPYNFIRELVKDHQVYLATFRTAPEHDMTYLRQLAEWGVVARTVEHPTWKGAVNCLQAIYRPQPLRALWIQSGALENAIRELLAQYPIEVAHFDRMRMGHFAMPLKNLPRVVDFTDALSLYLERTGTSHRSLGGRLVDTWERWSIPRYEAKLLAEVEMGLCCSSVDQAVFRRDHPKREVAVIPNSVDTEQFRPRSAAGVAPRLVFTGTFSYFPNIDSLFYFLDSIWPEVRRAFPDLALDVIGARPPQKVLALDKQPGIRVQANVPDMAQCLLSQDIFICPLRVASGIRNKVLEAMAAGMAVISSRIGVEGLEVKAGVHYLEADTPGEFLVRLRALLESEELRGKLGNAAREYVVENHSGAVAAEALVQLFEKAKKR